MGKTSHKLVQSSNLYRRETKKWHWQQHKRHGRRKAKQQGVMTEETNTKQQVGNRQVHNGLQLSWQHRIGIVHCCGLGMRNTKIKYALTPNCLKGNSQWSIK